MHFDEFISVKGIRAQGNQLSSHKIKQVNSMSPIDYVPPIEIPHDEVEVVNDEEINEEGSSNQATLF